MSKAITEEAVQLKPGQRWLADSLPVRLQLVEDSGPGGKIVVRGEFARADRATENKRLYPLDLWDREISKLSASMKDRKLLGELDHPNDGRTQLSRVSHLITGLSITDEGLIMGEAEALDTARGKDLQAMLKAGCKVGVSSRGYGSTRTNEKGEEVVQEDYNLVTFDFVAEPADSTAYPEVFSENKETGMGGIQAQREADQAKAKAFAARVEQDAQAAKGDDDDETKVEDIVARLGKLSAEAREKIRSELMSDPKVGGAKTAIEQVVNILRPFILPEGDAEKADDDEKTKMEQALKEKDLRIADLSGQVESLASMAREAGYKYYLERVLSGHPEKDLVMKLVGDLSQYTEAVQLKTKLTGVLSELKERMEQEAARVALHEERQQKLKEEREAERRNAAKQVQSLKEDVNKLSGALEKALEANKLMGLQLYARERLNSHPEGAKIMRLVEASGAGSREEIDALIEEHRIEEKSEDDLSQVRARVRRLTGGGFGSTPKDEETPRTPRKPLQEGKNDYNGLGVDLGTLKQLSGIRH